MGRQQLRGDVRPHRVTDDVCSSNPEMIQQTKDIQAHLPSIGVHFVWLSALAMSAGVKSDDAVILRQIRQDARIDPRVEGTPVAVNQDDYLSTPRIHISNAHPVGIEKLVLCESGHRYQQKI